MPAFLFGQEVKKITDNKNKETFYVLKTDKKIKHGAYERSSFNNKLLIKGFYKLGQRDSIWECYDFNGRLTLKYDFTKDEVIMYRPFDQVKDKRFKIINQSNLSDTTILTRPPIFLGGDSYITSELVNNLRYPLLAFNARKSGKIMVSFIIDKHGKTSNYHVKTPIGYGLDEEAIKLLKNLPDNWLPGLLNGQAVDVEVTYPISFVLQVS